MKQKQKYWLETKIAQELEKQPIFGKRGQSVRIAMCNLRVIFPEMFIFIYLKYWESQSLKVIAEKLAEHNFDLKNPELFELEALYWLGRMLIFLPAFSNLREEFEKRFPRPPWDRKITRLGC